MCQDLNIDLNKFITAQNRDYKTALNEIKNGKKITHWMWYIFPQIKGLGHSPTAQYYAINDVKEARLYLKNTFLRNNLIEILNELIKLPTNDPISIFGKIDAMKFQSSMTLFYIADPTMFPITLNLIKFYNGKLDQNTLNILNVNINSVY